MATKGLDLYRNQSIKDHFETVRSLVISRDIYTAVVGAAIMIMLTILLGYENNLVIPSAPDAREATSHGISFLTNYDGTYYLAIAKHGYTNLVSAGFYPFYPLLVRVFSSVIGSYLISAVLVSWLGFIGAIYFYLKIIRQLSLTDTTATRLQAVLPFIFFPTAVFLMATYTEGLFAALALASVYFSLRRRYIIVGSLLLLANATHITGILLIVLDALILWEEKVVIKKVATTVFLGILGAGAFMTYLYIRFHNATAFIQSQTVVHEWLGKGYLHLLRTATPLHALFTILLLTSTVYYWPRRKSFSIYSASFFLIPILGTQWGGFDRYVLMAFPIPLMAYEALRHKPQAYLVAIMCSSILWAYILLQYAAGYIGS